MESWWTWKRGITISEIMSVFWLWDGHTWSPHWNWDVLINKHVHWLLIVWLLTLFGTLLNVPSCLSPVWLCARASPIVQIFMVQASGQKAKQTQEATVDPFTVSCSFQSLYTCKHQSSSIFFLISLAAIVLWWWLRFRWHVATWPENEHCCFCLPDLPRVLFLCSSVSKFCPHYQKTHF